MMPWEHVVVGYLGYSMFVHIVYRQSPTAGETAAVVFASLLPDLIDKPLAWEFGVFESGYALGHSVFFAIPLSIVVGVLFRQLGRPKTGLAFGIGYLLHLPADVIPIYIQSGRWPIDRLLWPVRSTSGNPPDGFRDGLVTHVGNSLELLVNLEQSLYMQGVVALMVFALLLWVYDGMPMVREPLVWLSRQV